MNELQSGEKTLDDYRTDTCAEANLTEQEKQRIGELTNHRNCTKGEILLNEGDIQNACFHVIKGCLRQYYLIDGEEKNIAFFIEDESITSGKTGESKFPSKFYVECLEDSIVSVMTNTNEEVLFKEFPRLESICRLSLEEQLTINRDRFATYMVSNPEQRYLNMLETRGDLINRISQYHLASYLGVKPESLSRIRKRLASKQIS